jgi:hypothetical protein
MAPEQYVAAWNALLAAMPTLVAEINAEIVGMNFLASGGAYTLPYKYSSNTADNDPASGWLRLNNTTQSSATQMFIDDVGVNGLNYSGLLDQFGASTNPVKGCIRLTKMGDPTKYITFNVTALTIATGYRKLTIGSAWGTSPSPFVDGDNILMHFDRAGDLGATGPVYTHGVLHVRDEKAANTGGGTATVSTWNTRTLNTVKKNSISGASLSANRVTLPVGTYEVYASAPACGSSITHKIKLQNITDNTPTLVGGGISGGLPGGRSEILGMFDITGSSKQFEIQHWIVTASNGDTLGYPVGAEVEVYAEVLFKKVA